MIRVSPSLLGLSSYTAAWIICTCIIRFTFKPLIDIDFSVTLRCFTRQLFETTKLPYDINIDFSRRLPILADLTIPHLDLSHFRLVPLVHKALLLLRILRLVTPIELQVENPTHATAHAPEKFS